MIEISNRLINRKVFQFSKSVKRNCYTTNYFLKAKTILQRFKRNNRCQMQFIHFSEQAFVCGIEEVIALLRSSLTKRQLKHTSVYVAESNAIIDSKTPIMLIDGYYFELAYLENIIDGILSARMSVATNAFNCISALQKHQQIIYMNDRNTSYFNQPYDAYAAYEAGINLFVTQAQVSFFKDDVDVKVVGTMPHALIQQYDNDLISLVHDYKDMYPNSDLYLLIDYDNDAIQTLEKNQSILNKVAGVRLDTSSKLKDKSAQDDDDYGVSVKLIELVKKWLIEHGFGDKKIIITSQINSERIKMINAKTSAVDYYGIGSFFNYPSVHVSADLVTLNGRPQAKYGRKLLSNWKKLKKVQLV